MSPNTLELLEILLELEARSAQLDAALEADPEIGMAWRAQMGLAEAAASVRLEDVPVLEGDILVREIEGRPVSDDVMRGIDAAAGFLRVLGRPGSLAQDPGAVVARCWKAGQVHPEADVLQGVGGEPGDLAPPAEDLAARVAAAISAAPTAFLAGLRGACLLRQETIAGRPASERLLFMLCEHQWRSGRGAVVEPVRGRIAPADAIASISARWVLLPSLALSRHGFRAWSPLSDDDGTATLLRRLSGQVSRDVGSLPVLRRWRARAEALGSGRHGRSRARDLAATVIAKPVVSASSLARDLGITPRGALNLISEAVDAGVISPLVARKTWRCWATTPLAETLRTRSAFASRTGSVTAHAKHASIQDLARDPQGASMPQAEPPAPARLSQEEIEARQAKVLERLDDALAEVDAVLKKYGAAENAPMM